MATSGVTLVKEINEKSESVDEKVKELIREHKENNQVLLDKQEAQLLLQAKKIEERRINLRNKLMNPIIGIYSCLKNGTLGNFPYANWQSRGHSNKLHSENEKEAYSIFCVGDSAKMLFNRLEYIYKHDTINAVKYIQHNDSNKNQAKEVTRGVFNKKKSGYFNRFDMYIFGKNSSRKRNDGAQCSKVYDPQVLDEETGDIVELEKYEGFICTIPISFTSGFFNYLKSKEYIRNKKVYFPSEKTK